MKFIYGDKSDTVLDLQGESKKVNEKLITSQILANSLDRVYNVFEKCHLLGVTFFTNI